MVVRHDKKNRKKKGYSARTGLRRRGSGNRGGVGKAGHGKRMKQKKQMFMVDGKVDYGKHGFTSKTKQIYSVTVGILSEEAVKFGEKKGQKYLVDAKGKKVISSGVVRAPILLSNYYSITEKAKNKILKAGGEVVAK